MRKIIDKLETKKTALFLPYLHPAGTLTRLTGQASAGAPCGGY